MLAVPWMRADGLGRPPGTYPLHLPFAAGKVAQDTFRVLVEGLESALDVAFLHALPLFVLYMLLGWMMPASRLLIIFVSKT